MGAGIPGYSGGPISSEGLKLFGCLMAVIGLAFMGVVLYLAFGVGWRTEDAAEVVKLAACFIATLMTTGYLVWRAMG